MASPQFAHPLVLVALLLLRALIFHRFFGHSIFLLGPSTLMLGLSAFLLGFGRPDPRRLKRLLEFFPPLQEIVGVLDLIISSILLKLL